MIWKLPIFQPRLAELLAEQLNLSPEIGSFLAARKFSRPEEVLSFKDLRLEQLPAPSDLPDIEAAAHRLIEAHKKSELIAICGDYDADGLTASAVLAYTLKGLGHRTLVRIPHRLHEGYGFKTPAVRELAAQKVKLIVTVDCGVSDHETIKEAQKLGIEVIITDHHKLPPTLPQAVAVVNPHREGPFKNTQLAGVGVAFFVAGYLRRAYVEAGLITRDQLPPLADLLALVALGTVADVVPLTKVNRILVRQGLSLLSAPQSPGLIALKEIAGLGASSLLTARDIAFKLATRLNAAGRLGSAQPALELLLAKDLESARAWAAELELLNRQRYDCQNQTIDEALEKAEEKISSQSRTIVLASENWSKGIVGLAAARLAERFRRPTVLLALEGDFGVGSGRSRPGFNLYEALNELRDLFEAFGGHEQAAGLTIKAERLSEFKASFEIAAAAQSLGEQDEELAIDLETNLRGLLELTEPLAALGPFGSGHAEPVVVVRNLKVNSAQMAGRGLKHLKLTVTDESCRQRTLWGFNLAWRQAEIKRHLDLACTLEISVYQGRLTPNWLVTDFKSYH